MAVDKFKTIDKIEVNSCELGYKLFLELDVEMDLIFLNFMY
jgi:hypothetical protein